MTLVANEVAFGLENLGVAAGARSGRASSGRSPSVDALASLGPEDDRALRRRAAARLPRVGARARAAAAAPRRADLAARPRRGARSSSTPSSALGATVVLSEHRVARALELATRVALRRRRPPRSSTRRARRRVEWLAAERPARSIETLAFLKHKLLRATSSLLGSRRLVRVPRGPAGARRRRPRGPARRDRRARRAERLRKDDAGEDRGRPARAAGRHASQLRAAPAYLSQDPGRYLVKETALDEVALAVNGDEQRARAALDRVGLGWAADRHPRDLSSGERERLALAAVAVPEPDLLILDEPTRGIDPERKAELGRVARGVRGVREGRRSSRRTTATSRRTGGSALCFRDTSGSTGGPRCRLGSPPVARRGRSGSPPGPRSTPPGAGSRRCSRRSRCSRPAFAWLEGGDDLGARPDARRHARRPRRRRSRPLRAGPERPAGDGDRRRRGRRARPAPRLRGRRARRDRVQLLPRPGPAHAVADARVGRLRRCSPGSLGTLLRRRLAFAAFCFALGFAFGMLMDLWLWFAFYPHTEAALLARPRPRAFPFNVAHAIGNVVARARRRAGAATRARTATSGARAPRSCGREAARAASRAALTAPASTPVALRPGAAARAAVRELRADAAEIDRLGDARRSPPPVADDAVERARTYLARQQPRLRDPDRVALVAMARARGGRPARRRCCRRLRAHRPGKLVNATIWTILALRQAGEPAPPGSCAALRQAQRPSGGWSWSPAARPTRTTRRPRSRRCAPPA